MSRYAALSREQLGTLVPELLLCGHLVDRSGMAWCLAAWGREEMTQVAIEEWSAASPIYTRRMQRALGFEGDDVVTVFKGLQLDIGAPPQFMDFRFTVHDPWHGEFRLDHCGALMDVEPMGPAYVTAMCHDIEDPTFDATAVATNPRAQVRPIHRPPRSPAERRPHCAWSVVIDASHPEVTASEGCQALAQSRAATLELEPIDASDSGRADYSGPLVGDIDFGSFSHSALVRIADEVALQMHLLALGFVRALRQRADEPQVREIATKQLVGIAGVTAGRLQRALELPRDVDGALRVLELHPLLNPAAYVEAAVDDSVRVHTGPAHEDGGWITLCGPGSARPLQAIVQEVDPHLDVEITGSTSDWTARVVRGDTPAPRGRGGHRDQGQHRRRVRVRAPPIPAHHAGMTAFVSRFDFRAPSADAATRQELYGRALEQAAYLDEHGHDAIMVSEHHASDDGYLPSPLVVTAAIAARTTRVPITVSALLVNFYEPVKLAEDVAVLDHLSAGRVSYTLGLGYRPEEYALFGRPWETRGADIERRIELLLALWRGEEVAHDGRTVSITPLPFTQPHPFLFYGGGSPAAARRAARLGLNFQPNVADKALRDLYDEECRRHGREPGFVLLPPTGPGTVFCAEDPDRFWASYGEHLLADAMAYRAWSGPLNSLITDDSTTVEELRAGGRYVVLDPDELVRQCRSRELRAVSGHPMCGGLPAEPSWESLRLICERVAPALRDA